MKMLIPKTPAEALLWASMWRTLKHIWYVGGCRAELGYNGHFVSDERAWANPLVRKFNIF